MVSQSYWVLGLFVCDVHIGSSNSQIKHKVEESDGRQVYYKIVKREKHTLITDQRFLRPTSHDITLQNTLHLYWVAWKHIVLRDWVSLHGVLEQGEW